MNERKQMSPLTKNFLRLIAFAVVLAAAAFLLSGGPKAIQDAYSESYHRAMAPTLRDPGFTPQGQKAIAIMDGMYTKMYIPQLLRTDDPTQVRYVLHITKHTEHVGMYYNYPMGRQGDAYQYIYTVELEDLATGQIIAIESFEGGDPPSSSSDGKDHYGSPPSTQTIMDWVSRILNH